MKLPVLLDYLDKLATQCRMSSRSTHAGLPKPIIEIFVVSATYRKF